MDLGVFDDKDARGIRCPSSCCWYAAFSLTCSVEVGLYKWARHSETFEDAGYFYLIGHGMCAQAISKLAEGGVQLPQVKAIKPRDTNTTKSELAF